MTASDSPRCSRSADATEACPTTSPSRSGFVQAPPAFGWVRAHDVPPELVGWVRAHESKRDGQLADLVMTAQTQQGTISVVIFRPWDSEPMVTTIRSGQAQHQITNYSLGGRPGWVRRILRWVSTWLAWRERVDPREHEQRFQAMVEHVIRLREAVRRKEEAEQLVGQLLESIAHHTGESLSTAPDRQAVAEARRALQWHS